MTIIGGVVYEKSMLLEIFGAYLSKFLISLHEIFFGSKILPISCDKHQKFDYGYSRYPETRLKVAISAILDPGFTREGSYVITHVRPSVVRSSSP